MTDEQHDNTTEAGSGDRKVTLTLDRSSWERLAAGVITPAEAREAVRLYCAAPADEAGAHVYAVGNEMFEVVYRIGGDKVCLFVGDATEAIEMPIEEAAWLGARLTEAANAAKRAD